MCIALLLPPLPVATQMFVEVGRSRGIGAYAGRPLTGGLAAADYDDDGDIDVFVPTAAGAIDLLYRNRGDGRFEEVAEAAGVASRHGHRAALWFDYDADHDLDLLVVGDCFQEECEGSARLVLYRQTSGRFDDVTIEAQLPRFVVDGPEQHVGGLCAGDINEDGYLDVVVAFWTGRLHVFLNDGGATFTAARWPELQTSRRHWQPVLHDFDADGWLDLFVAVDYDTPNLLWINQRDGSFRDHAKSALMDNRMNDMGIAPGDYDNDGDLDIFVTNIAHQGRHNVLHRNDSVAPALRFTEVSAAAGVGSSGWAWGATFFDGDNDGWLDLAVTNGFAGLFSTDRSRYFRNLGGDPVTFQDVSEAVGFDDEFVASGLVAFDADRDGDLDLLQACQGPAPQLRLLDNGTNREEHGHHYIVIQPRMQGPNRRALGAVVRVSVGARTLTRSIAAGTSLMGQEPAEAFFGLGQAPRVDRLTILWPDESQSVLENLPANRVYVVEHPGTAQQPPGAASVLLAPAPNPFNGVTKVRFRLAAAGDAVVQIFDPRGHLLWHRTVRGLPAGEHAVLWPARGAEGRALASGSYLVLLEALGERSSRRAVLVK